MKGQLTPDEQYRELAMGAIHEHVAQLLVVGAIACRECGRPLTEAIGRVAVLSGLTVAVCAPPCREEVDPD